MIRLERIEDRRKRLGAEEDVVAGRPGQRAGGCGDEGDRLGMMADDVLREHGLVVPDQVDDVLAGDVRGGQENDVRPVEAGVTLDREEAGMRLGRSDGRPVPGIGEAEVVDVAGLPGDLLDALATGHRAPGHASADGRLRLPLRSGVLRRRTLDCGRGHRR